MINAIKKINRLTALMSRLWMPTVTLCYLAIELHNTQSKTSGKMDTVGGEVAFTSEVVTAQSTAINKVQCSVSSTYCDDHNVHKNRDRWPETAKIRISGPVTGETCLFWRDSDSLWYNAAPFQKSDPSIELFVYNWHKNPTKSESFGHLQAHKDIWRSAQLSHSYINLINPKNDANITRSFISIHKSNYQKQDAEPLILGPPPQGHLKVSKI